MQSHLLSLIHGFSTGKISKQDIEQSLQKFVGCTPEADLEAHVLTTLLDSPGVLQVVHNPHALENILRTEDTNGMWL